MRGRRTLVAAAATFGLITMAVSLTAGPAAATVTGPLIATSGLDNAGRPCATASDPAVRLGQLADTLEAYGTDAASTDYSATSYTFQIWPAANQGAATSYTTSAFSTGLGRYYVPSGVESDGLTYAWRAQMTDANGTSPWSATCLFTYDATPPGQATITSSNFPTSDQGFGPAGTAAQFTMSGGGDTDVVAFLYGWGSELPVLGCPSSGPQGQLVCPDLLSQPGVIAASTPGGTASVSLVPPGSGPQTFSVEALDAAGNVAVPAAQYRIFVPSTYATITQTSAYPTCGSSVTVKFAPNPAVTGVTSYRYGLNGDTSLTVAAAADGTAKVTLPVTTNDYFVTARSVSASGFVSDAGYLTLDVNPQVTVSANVYLNSGQPTGAVGVPDTFTFSPPYDGSYPAGYRYKFVGATSGSVPADPSSLSGTLPFTPNRPGPWTMTVTALNDDGTTSCPLTYAFKVATGRH